MVYGGGASPIRVDMPHRVDIIAHRWQAWQFPLRLVNAPIVSGRRTARDTHRDRAGIVRAPAPADPGDARAAVRLPTTHRSHPAVAVREDRAEARSGPTFCPPTPCGER